MSHLLRAVEKFSLFPRYTFSEDYEFVWEHAFEAMRWINQLPESSAKGDTLRKLQSLVDAVSGSYISFSRFETAYWAADDALLSLRRSVATPEEGRSVDGAINSMTDVATFAMRQRHDAV